MHRVADPAPAIVAASGRVHLWSGYEFADSTVTLLVLVPVMTHVNARDRAQETRARGVVKLEETPRLLRQRPPAHRVRYREVRLRRVGGYRVRRPC